LAQKVLRPLFKKIFKLEFFLCSNTLIFENLTPTPECGVGLVKEKLRCVGNNLSGLFLYVTAIGVKGIGWDLMNVMYIVHLLAQMNKFIKSVVHK
jgi:hypothetical protein